MTDRKEIEELILNLTAGQKLEFLKFLALLAGSTGKERSAHVPTP